MRNCCYRRWYADLSISAKHLLTTAFMLLLLLAANIPLFAQTKIQVSGIISNEKGEPVGGASITEKGTVNGTVSQENGHFTISVSGKKSVLVITHTGFATLELQVANNTDINVVLLSETKAMNEVVVVGYGTQKKTTVTGAVSSVKGTDLVKSSSANISNAIAGRIPGVIANNRSGRPGADESSLSIRGINSFSGGTAPLFVIDGIPDRNFARINPNDIESITVLKDASAAIYGVRAANGVILVTTKRGKTGKPTIQYDGSYGVQQLTRLPQIVNAWQYMTYYNEINPNTYAQTEIDKYKAGTDPNYTSTDWLREVFRKNAPQTSHAISVSGGTENVKYYFSGQYVDQTSNFKNSIEHYKQFNIRSNIDARINRNLKVNLDIAARQEDRTFPSWDVSSILHETRSLYPFVPARWLNGSYSAGLAGGRNPLIMVSDAPGYNKTKNYVITPLAGFEFKMPFITEGLSVSGYASYDINLAHNKVFNKPWDAYNYNKTTGIYTNMRGSTGIPNVKQNESMYNGSTRFIKLAYDRQFGLHAINAFAGYEVTTTSNWATTAYRTNLLSDQIDQLFTGTADGQDANGSASQDGRASYLGRVAYDFANKYLAEVSMRYNGSFNFPAGKKWGNFPSVSIGWRISEEKFFKENVSFIDQFKIRASWGIMGNDAVAQYQFLKRYLLLTNSTYFTYFGNYVRTTAMQLGGTENVNITWEKQDTRNIGFDATLLKGKLAVTADYFRYLRSDILAKRNASIPLYTGMNLPDENIGKSLNRGVDFSITYSDRIGELEYSVAANGTYAKSKVLFRDEAAAIPVWQKSEGYPIDSWLLYATNGIYRSQEEINKSPHLPGARVGDLWIKDIDGNGSITANDQVRTYQTATPKVVYGFNIGLSYKGISLSMLLSGQAMAKQLANSQIQGSLIAPPQWLYDGRWTAGNPNGQYPRAFNSNSINAGYNNYTDFWLRDASFLRLKNLEIAYTVPSHVYNKLGFSSLRVYANGFNLLSFDKMKKYGIDPETNSVTGTVYPQSRIFRFGINVGL
jgi:TonB-linked SusC/RagA family outer membrane protein